MASLCGYCVVVVELYKNLCIAVDRFDVVTMHCLISFVFLLSLKCFLHWKEFSACLPFQFVTESDFSRFYILKFVPDFVFILDFWAKNLLSHLVIVVFHYHCCNHGPTEDFRAPRIRPTPGHLPLFIPYAGPSASLGPGDPSPASPLSVGPWL